VGLGGFGRGVRLELRRTRVTETRHVTRAHGHGRVSLEMNDVYRLDSGYESRGGARAPARRFIIRRAYTRCVRDMPLCLVSVVARGHAHGDESGEERAQCMRVPFINLQDTRDSVATPRPSPAQTLYNTCVTITRRPAHHQTPPRTHAARAGDRHARALVVLLFHARSSPCMCVRACTVRGCGG